MVLWEITLGTAYFLGLKRTYRLALKIQRKLISPKHPKIRQFAHRYPFLPLIFFPLAIQYFLVVAEFYGFDVIGTGVIKYSDLIFFVSVVNSDGA